MTCHNCRTWKNCTGKVWYRYSEIRFCLRQFYWLIEKLSELEHGWPKEEKSMISAGSPIGRGVKAEATFCRAMGVRAEVMIRIGNARKDGQVLLKEVSEGKTLEELSYEAKCALWFCSGSRRKLMPYFMWKKQRSYRNKVVNKSKSQDVSLDT